MSATQKENNSFVYYNGSFTSDQYNNPFPVATIAKFEDQRKVAILERPDDYVMSVIRWSLPTSGVPLTILRPISYVPIPPYTTPNTNINLLNFAVGLSWFDTGVYHDFNTYLVYVPQNNDPIPTLPQTSNNEGYWYIYSIQIFLNMINTAYADCFARLKAHYPGAPGTVAPRIVYDPVSQLYHFYVEDAYQAPAINPAAPTNPDPNIRFGSQTAITIWQSFNLALLFTPGFNEDFTSLNNTSQPDPDTGYTYIKTSRIIVENNTGLPNTGFTNVFTEFSVVSNLVSLQTIVLTSDSLPINYESINPANLSSISSASNNTLQIISDFTYDIFDPNTSFSGRLGVVYIPSVYRFTNLNSAQPLTRVNVTAQFIDSANVLHDIILRENSQFSFKIMFIKKEKLDSMIRGGEKIDGRSLAYW